MRTPSGIDIRSPLHPNWVRVYPPSEACPYWHEQDGTRHSFSALAAGQDDAFVERLIEAHAQAVWELLHACFGAEPARLRALALAAGRLGEEVAGLWPTPPAPELRAPVRSGQSRRRGGATR